MSDKTINVELKFSRKTIIYLIILVLLGLLVLVNYKYKIIEKGLSYYNRASASIIVLDKETKKPIPGALVAVNNITSQANNSGLATINKLEKGESNFFISQNGYTDLFIKFSLKRGTNDLGQVSLSKKPDKTSGISGTITNLFSSEKISNVLLTAEGASVNSTSDGSYTLTGLPLKKIKVKATKAGYNNYEKEINLTEAPYNLQLNLVPRGKVYFTSDRDGKSAIYQSDLDGSSVEKLVNNVKDGTNESAQSIDSSSFWPSPDYKHIAFLSAGDNPKNENQKNLYISDIKGQDIKKLSDDINPYNLKWVSPNKISYIVYQDGKYNLKVINTDDQNSTQLNENLDNYKYWYINGYDINSKGLFAYSLSATNQLENKSGVYTIKSEGGDREKLLDKSCENLMFSFDGKYIYCKVYQDNNEKNYKIDVENKTVAEGVNPFAKYYQRIKLSPDGKKVLYLDTRDGKSDLFLSDLDGKNEIKLTEVGSVSAFDWSSSGSLISYVSNKDGLEINVLSPISKEHKPVSTCNSYSVSLLDSF